MRRHCLDTGRVTCGLLFCKTLQQGKDAFIICQVTTSVHNIVLLSFLAQAGATEQQIRFYRWIKGQICFLRRLIQQQTPNVQVLHHVVDL